MMCKLIWQAVLVMALKRWLGGSRVLARHNGNKTQCCLAFGTALSQDTAANID